LNCYVAKLLLLTSCNTKVRMFYDTLYTNGKLIEFYMTEGLLIKNLIKNFELCEIIYPNVGNFVAEFLY